MPSPIAIVESLFARKTRDLNRFVAARFSRLSHDLVADAVADAFEVACADPELVARAWRQGGDAAALGLLRVIAWRMARAHVRRAAYNREVRDDAVLDIGRHQEPDQEFIVHVRRSLTAALIEGAKAARASDHAAVQAAVVDRLVSGDTDGEVAERHGVCREQVNRARGCVSRRILSED